MPYIALNSHNEEVTASYCRDEFLRSGVELTGFKCAFCLCTYYPRYIYVDGEIGRAPHFFVKGDKHKGACDGTPLGVVIEPASVAHGKKIPESGFSFPEKLVPKPRPRVVELPGVAGVLPSEEEIRVRRNRAGREYGTKMFTSSLLEVIVESKNKIVKWCFQQSRSDKLDKSAERQLLKATAGSYNLQLFDQKGLTYDTAFWSAHYERSKADRRIFHAKNGAVLFSKSSTHFVVRSEPIASPQNSAVAKSAARPVEVRYAGEDYTSSIAPQAHTRALATLAALPPNATIQWYAYGEMRLEGDELVIFLETLDHLFFR